MIFRKIRSQLTSLLVLMVLSLSAVAVVTPMPVFADSASKSAACEGIGLAGGGNCGAAAQNTVGSLFANIVKLLSWVVGAVAVVMIIIGGFKYVTSSGDSNAISSAKNTIIYALIGLAAAALAQVLVHFVLANVT